MADQTATSSELEVLLETENADELGDEGRKAVTYADLLDATQRFANVLKSLGVGKGDVVGIYLPMLPETVAAMLACARIGAIHNVVFGGFSAESVKEPGDGVAGEIPPLEHIVVVARGGTSPPMSDGRDVFWHDVVGEADAECE